MGHCFHKAVVIRFCHQIVDRKTASYNVHEKLIQLGRDLEQALVEGGGQRRLKLLSSGVDDHCSLLLVEEEPNSCDALQMLLAHPIEVRFGALQLLFALFFEHL